MWPKALVVSISILPQCLESVSTLASLTESAQSMVLSFPSMCDLMELRIAMETNGT